MINKEFIVKDGAIYKDFIDRNIPQYANNQVCVSVLIPSGVFVGNTDYSVILAVGYRVQSGSAITTLNTLVMSASKSITIDGTLFVKYSAILSYDYTQNIGQLLFSPYIRKIIHTQGEYDSESQTYEDVALITNQDAYTYTLLNVIKSVLPQYDASLEDSQVVDTLNGKIEAKKIYTFIDTDSASIGEHYYELVNGYDPNAPQFSGCLVISIYDSETAYYMPYLNNGDVELLEITSGGLFYKISDVDYSNSTYTYTRQQLSYTKAEIDSQVSDLQTQINGKVDKTQKVNGHALSGDITITKGDVGLGNVANYGVESTPTAVGDDLYITSKGVYDALQLVYTAISGCATDEDLTTINNRLDSIEAIIGSDDGDADSVINTLKEVIVVLQGLGETANILDLINAKANQSDLTTLQGTVNTISGKVDILYDSNHNAYAEITAENGITIETTDWVSNSDANYPYKFVLTNGYFTGATNVIVVFDKDSDTSLLSTTTEIDEENGTITLYATDLPSADITIEKIAVFNSVNAYILYNQTLVSQVNSNTQAISDINNTKLPQYTKKTKTIGNFTATIDIVEGGSTSPNLIRPEITIKKDNLHYAQIYAFGNNIGLGDVYGIGINVQNGSGTLTSISISQDLDILIGAIGGGQATIQVGAHALTFDGNGDLKIDGNAVGGGKQLYQHNVCLTNTSGDGGKFALTITNDSNVAFTIETLIAYLKEHQLNDSTHYLQVSGGRYESGYGGFVAYGIRYVSDDTAYILSAKVSAKEDIHTISTTSSNTSITDTIIAL